MGDSQLGVNEGDGTIELQIMRHGLTSEILGVIIETVDGTASSIIGKSSLHTKALSHVIANCLQV